MSKPFLPSDHHNGRPLERAILAGVWAALDKGQTGAVRIAEKTWPGDKATAAVLKASTAPADSTTTTWAKELSPTLTGDFVASLQPMSAAARLINAGIRLSLTGMYELNIPKRSTAKAASDVAWLAEGGPIPVKQYSLNTVTLGPTHKLPLMVDLTRELAEHGNGEAVITQLIREDLAASLDASLFDSTAAGSTRPAGLLNGVSAISATTTTNLTDAMLGDLVNIAAAISDAGGSGNCVYIASPKQASAAKLRLLTQATIWPCPALAAGTVVGVDPSAFVSAFGPEPRVQTTMQATVVEASPAAAVGTAGTPNVVGAPMRSLFQTDTISIKTILDAAWCMRQPGMVAWVTSTNW
jgi:hypothetical protein